MRDAILNFPKQFEYEPKIENGPLGQYDKFVVLGMGGSHLAADLLKTWRPELDVVVHKNYGLPVLSEEELKHRLIIASSYSGNTEEVLDGFEKARTKGLAVAVITVGGKLLELAQKYSIPYVKMPDTGIQPRSALGFSIRGLLKLMNLEDGLIESAKLAKTFKPEDYEIPGKELAQILYDRIPVIYSSERNLAIANNWKIKFNETSKIPAFCNAFPELNHNEMSAFDGGRATSKLVDKFHFIFLKDQTDHPKILKRMEILQKIFSDRKLPVEILEPRGKTALEKIFSSLLLADWTAVYIAYYYGLQTEEVAMQEEFKKLIAKEKGPCP